MEHGKIPPQAIDLEEAVLGAILLESRAISTVIAILKPESFYKEANQRIYSACVKLFSQSKPIDILTAANQLRQSGELETVGGPYYLSKLVERIAGATNIEYHSRIISQKFIQRELIRISTGIQRDAFDETTDPLELINRASLELLNLNNVGSTKSLEHISIVADANLKEIVRLKENPIDFAGLPTGFDKLDKTLCGLKGGELVIIAARPSMGKSAFMGAIANNLSINKDVPVALFSLEMTSRSLEMRIKSLRTNIFFLKLQKGDVEDWELEKLNVATAKIKSSRLYIDDSSITDIIKLRSKIIEARQRDNIQIAFIDYLQLIGSTDNSGKNREQVVSEISRGLKLLAKDLDIPIVALSQLSRRVEDRPADGKRPILSDLRESGAIEQDADVVIFLFRPEHYGIKSIIIGDEEIPTDNLCEAIVAKNRNGVCRTIPLYFYGSTLKFEDYEKGEGAVTLPF
jgi:replicative DNA helicase